MDDWVSTVGSVLMVISLALAVACVIAYSTKTRGAWKLTEVGRHLMAFMIAVAAVLAVAVLRIVLVDILGFADVILFQVVRVAIFAGIPAVLAWRLRIIITSSPDKENRP